MEPFAQILSYIESQEPSGLLNEVLFFGGDSEVLAMNPAVPLPSHGAGLTLGQVQGLSEEPWLPGHLRREPADKRKGCRTI